MQESKHKEVSFMYSETELNRIFSKEEMQMLPTEIQMLIVEAMEDSLAEVHDD